MSRFLVAAAGRGLRRVAAQSLGVARSAAHAIQRAHFTAIAQKFEAAEPLDPLLLADAAPAVRLEFASLAVPPLFQQYMRQLKMTLPDRLELLGVLRAQGAAATARWMLENVERFEAAAKKAAASASSSSSPAAAAAPFDVRSASLPELQVEYEHALRRHATRRARRLAATEQATVSDRVWLSELAEYAETLKSAAAGGSDAARAAFPGWSRFVLERRALEQFYAFVRAGGVWPGLPDGVERAVLLEVIRILHMARARPSQARKEAEKFRVQSAAHNELVRRFIEPAIGLMPADKATQIARREDKTKVPEAMRPVPEKIEGELARLIRVGAAPPGRLEHLVPYVFTEEELEEIVDVENLDPVMTMLERKTPDELDELERQVLQRPSIQMADWVLAAESGKHSEEDLIDKDPLEYGGPTEAEKAARKLVVDTIKDAPASIAPVHTTVDARARDADRRDSELLFSLRADQVGALVTKASFITSDRQQSQADAVIAEAEAQMQRVPNKQRGNDAEDQETISAVQVAQAHEARKEAGEKFHVNVLSRSFYDPLLAGKHAEAVAAAVACIATQAHDNVHRSLATLEALLQVPADAAYTQAILDAFERSKLRPDSLLPARVAESEVRAPASSKAAEALTVEQHLERLLRLELRLLADIDAQRAEMRARTPRERAKEAAALKNEAKELGIDLKKLQLTDFDRLREAVLVVRHAHAYFPNDPVHNGTLTVTRGGELLTKAQEEARRAQDGEASAADVLAAKAKALLGTGSPEEQAVLVLTHMLGLGFPASEARHTAAIVLANEQPPQAAPVMDALERAQLARSRTSTLVGQALLRLQLQASGANLTPADIDRTVFAVRELQAEIDARENERVDPLKGGAAYDDEFGSGQQHLLPSLRTAQTLPEHADDMLALNPVPKDFDGETDLERELERRDHWRRNRWADIMSSRKYEEVAHSEVNPLENPEIMPRHLDPLVCRQVYETYKANPRYWTPLRLSCQFRLKLERIEAILTLWYIEDCHVARGELPSFESGERKRVDGGPDDRHFDGVVYLNEEFVENSGNFYRDRPEALFLTQEDLERFMWRRSRPFRDFARRPNLFAGKAIPSLAGQHRTNRFKLVVQDTSEGRNHPAPLLTVRDPDGKYRYATEHEYMHEIDTRGKRPRRKEETQWEFEYIRRRLVQAGYHYSLLGSAECPVAGPAAKEARDKAAADAERSQEAATALEAADAAAAARKKADAAAAAQATL